MAHNALGTTQIPRTKDLVFTLVHGTFARKKAEKGKAWSTDPESPLRTGLAKAFGSRVLLDDGFRWTGANAHKDRIKASEGLKRYLTDAENRPRTQAGLHFLVGHSHGGNICLYALRDPSVRKRIDGVVCMATPFLLSRKRPLEKGLLWASTVFFLFLALVYELQKSGALGLATGLAVAYALLVLIVAVARKRKVEDRLKLLSQPEFEHDDLLVIRQSGDEASGVLRASQFGNWLLTKLWAFVSRAWAYLLTAAILMVWAVKPAVKWLAGEEIADEMIRLLDGLMSPIVLGVVVGGAALFVLMMILRLAFGWDAFRWVVDVETNAEDAPIGSSKVVVLPPEVEGKWRLAHSEVCDREETVDSIVEWVRAKKRAVRMEAAAREGTS